MKNIEIIGTGKYIPKKEVTNQTLATELGVTTSYIFQRTGIKTRFFVDKETIEEMAIMATKNAIEKSNFAANDIDMIIVATSSSNHCMPGISYLIQKAFDIPNVICFDIYAGCSSYINAIDIARNYITIGKVQSALVVGVDLLSDISKDLGTKIILADGAGATLLKATEETKMYYSHIESEGQKGEILEYQAGKQIVMHGKEVYRYAVTKTVENVRQLLDKTAFKVEDIDYYILHQSNKKIIDAIRERLKIPEGKVYTNIARVGNTFCASIPICLDEMKTQGMLHKKDRVLFLGYGGGLNTGSILLEV